MLLYIKDSQKRQKPILIILKIVLQNWFLHIL